MFRIVFPCMLKFILLILFDRVGSYKYSAIRCLLQVAFLLYLYSNSTL